MDIFKQNLAPIPGEAWNEINARAETVFNTNLTTRKSLLVDGPHGFNKTTVSTGRLIVVKGKEGSNVDVGLYDVKSLLETRVNFSLSRWELDNVIRGTKDIDLEALESAAKELALYEENTIYNGNAAVNIKGLMNEASHQATLKDDAQEILNKIAESVINLKESFVEKPFNLVVGKKLFKMLNKLHGNRLLRTLVEELIGGQVIFSPVVNGGLLLPVKHPDIEFTIGQDYTIGYASHNEKDIKLFIMNSYTLRVLDPNILVKFNL